MGIFGRNINAAYGPALPLAVTSPWSPGDSMVTFAVDQLIGDELSKLQLITRETALRVPGVKRAHGIACSMFARVPFYVMEGDKRAVQQPKWLTTSASGVSPYHAKFGLASDWFFYGWACLGFTRDLADALHIPFGLWDVDGETGRVTIDTDKVPARYGARPVVLPLGYGENGLLTDGLDTLRQARKIEAAYQDRLDNPIPLTVLGVPREVWERWNDDERKSYQSQWVEGRRNGGVALKIAEFPVEMPGQVAVDLYESGRNAVRLDIANHTAMPAGLLEGLKQGGSGGTEMKYSGVSNGGTARNELWDFGLPSRFVAAFEARMSLDDIVPSGQSIRGDLTAEFATPNPNTNPTSED